MPTVVVTGSASGMGAATSTRLRAGGATVIGVDLHDAEVVADLGTAEGRRDAIDGVTELSGGTLDGLVTFAGINSLPGRSAAAVVSVNYFGTVTLLDGLRPLLACGERPADVAISSNSTTCSPGIPVELVEACLAGDEAAARAIAEPCHWGQPYPASKMAIARWVRHHAVTPEWIGAGITLNAVAPGMIDTPMIEEGRRDPEVGPALDQFPIPAGRPGRPEELAALVAFLLGPEARFFVGSLVFADGGTDALCRPDDWPAPWLRRA